MCHMLRASLVLACCVAGAATVRAQTPITRMSVRASGNQALRPSLEPAISADGRFVAFTSFSKGLINGDTNGTWDIFVKERATGAIVRVSVSSSGTQSDDQSLEPSLSSDGRFVAFMSDATNLVSGDTNKSSDVFVRDRDPDGNGVFDEGNATTEIVSVDSNGKEGNSASMEPALSGDGMLVAFSSYASNLVANDKNNKRDVFVHDRSTGATIRVSVDSNGVEGNGESNSPAISADGTGVAFESIASNFDAADNDGVEDIFFHDVASGSTEWVSKASYPMWSEGHGRPALSSDGALVAFASASSNLVPYDNNGMDDVFVLDRTTGTFTRESVDSAGNQSNGYSEAPALSADGSVVVFPSGATDLVPNDTNGDSDIFLHDRGNGSTTVVSTDCTGVVGDGPSFEPPAISADAQVVAFSSRAEDLVDDDTNGCDDVFALDRTVAPPQASWTGYGAGWPGTYGIPTFTASADPVFGATISLDISNSLQFWTVGFVLVGASQASIPTRAGGTILVDFVLITTVPLASNGYSILGTVPFDPTLCGATADLQVIELDAGASAGLSFTPGLELFFGH